MIIPSEEQIDARWDTLPESLRSAMFSEEYSDLIQNAAAKAGVPEDKVPYITGLVGYVLMGFIQPEELQEEIVKGTSADSKTAAALSKTIASGIFNPLKKDIGLVYQPVSTAAPSPVRDISAPTMIGVSVSPTPPPPVPLSQKGWSAMKPNDPALKIPMPQQPSRPVPIEPPMAMGEFARIDASPVKNTPSPIPSPLSGQKAATSVSVPPPAPIMIQQNVQPATPPKNSDFHIRSVAGNAEMAFEKKSAPKTVSAVIEFAGKKESLTNMGGMAKNTPTPPDRRPSFATPPIIKEGTRTVTEITASGVIPSPAPQPVVKSAVITPAPAPTPLPITAAPRITMPTPRPTVPPTPVVFPMDPIKPSGGSPHPAPPAPPRPPAPKSVPAPIPAPAPAPLAATSATLTSPRQDTPKVIVKNFTEGA